MKARILILSMFLAGFVLQGCETVKGASRGLKTDVDNTWHNLTDQDGALKKADTWTKEHMW